MSGLLLINKATSFLLHSNVGGYNKSTAGEVVKDRPAQRDRIRADVLKRMKAKPDETTVEWGHQPWKRKELLAEYKQPSRYVPFHVELPPEARVISDDIVANLKLSMMF